MPHIYQMSPQLSNLIAAGEVVERPGSVVKELVENAVDAGAKHVTVELKHGGVTYIRVTDDGCGILPEDARTAFLRHATSKIRTERDLAAIGTLGFRGEALAAIASVSRVDLFTRTADRTEGVQLSLEAGEETGWGETGCPVGTTIVVRDLFFNVPARAKFLKKDATEGAFAESLLTQVAIARPGVAFRFIKDGRESFSTPGDGKMLSAIYACAGRELAGNLTAISGQVGDIAVGGYISRPECSRANRSQQSFYINGRYIRSRLLSAAVEEAYKGKMTVGRYPVCFLELRLSPGAVDVNVHPAKLEVKFSREKEVFSAVYHCVVSALEAGEELAQLRARPSALAPREDRVTREQQELELPRPREMLSYTRPARSRSKSIFSWAACLRQGADRGTPLRRLSRPPRERWPAAAAPGSPIRRRGAPPQSPHPSARKSRGRTRRWISSRGSMAASGRPRRNSRRFPRNRKKKPFSRKQNRPPRRPRPKKSALPHR